MGPCFCPAVFSSPRMDDPVTAQRLLALHAIPVVPALTVPLPPTSSSAVQGSDGRPLHLQMHDRQLSLSVFDAIGQAAVHRLFPR